MRGLCLLVVALACVQGMLDGDDDVAPVTPPETGRGMTTEDPVEDANAESPAIQGAARDTALAGVSSTDDRRGVGGVSGQRSRERDGRRNSETGHAHRRLPDTRGLKPRKQSSLGGEGGEKIPGPPPQGLKAPNTAFTRRAALHRRRMKTVLDEIYHPVTPDSFPYIYCGSKSRCDYNITKVLPPLPRLPNSEPSTHAHATITASPGSPLLDFLRKELKTDQAYMKLTTEEDMNAYLNYDVSFSKDRSLCCMQHILVPAGIVMQSNSAEPCTRKKLSGCSTSAMLGEHVNDNFIIDEAHFSKIVGRFNKPPPGVIEKKQKGAVGPGIRAPKSMASQILLILKRFEDIGFVARSIGWNKMRFTDNGQLMLKFNPPDTTATFGQMFMYLAQNMVAGNDFNPLITERRNLKEPHSGYSTPELNKRAIGPYFLNDYVVNRTLLARAMMKNQVAGDYREVVLQTHRPHHLNAPDIWQAAIMIIQVILKRFKHKLVRQLSNDKTFGGCASLMNPKEQRDPEVETATVMKMGQAVDFYMFAGTNRFQPGDPDVDWRSLEKSKVGMKFLPILKRMLNCDYEQRATVSEVMSYLVDKIEGPCFFSTPICTGKLIDYLTDEQRRMRLGRRRGRGREGRETTEGAEGAGGAGGAGGGFDDTTDTGEGGQDREDREGAAVDFDETS